MQHKKVLMRGVGSLLALTLLSGAVITAPNTRADSSSTVDITVNVPASCSLTPTNTDLYQTINPGETKEIGTAHLKAVCNDPSGFAIYAVGYTDDEYGNNDLVTNLGSSYSIETGISASPTSSQWNMTIDNDDVTGDHVATIENGFGSDHVVPDTYTKVASFDAATDQSIGSNITASFKAYIAPAQTAGTYEGKVRFLLVHPSNEQNPAGYLYYDANGGEGAPERQAGEEGTETNTYNYTISSTVPTKSGYIFTGWAEEPDATQPTYQPEDTITSAKPLTLYAVWRLAIVTTLDTGANVNAKLKNLANQTTNATAYTQDSSIKSFARSNSLPANFTASTENTISTSDSTIPVHIFFDGTNMYYYSQADIIYANADSSSMFYNLRNLVSFSNLFDINTSNVTDMSAMFINTGYNANNFSLDLSGWDTSSVTNMSNMFRNTGYNAEAFSLNLSGLTTSSVESMGNMFFQTGYSATESFSIIGLSGWNTSSVTYMNNMFALAGSSYPGAFSFDLSGWNTSNVTNMSNMFFGAGSEASAWSVGDISRWNTSEVKNMNEMFSCIARNVETLSLDLSGWDTSSVTSMKEMFYQAGLYANTISIDLSGWNTSSVTNMSDMFYETGRTATSWSVVIPVTNGNSIDNTTSRMYGGTTSTYAIPNSGKSFTIAQ